MEENVIEEEIIEKEAEEESLKKTKREHDIHFIVGLFGGALITLLIVYGVRFGKVLYQNYVINKTITEANSEESNPVTNNRELLNTKFVKKFKTLENIIDKYYLNEYSTDDLEAGAYAGMIDALGDKYAKYYTVEEIEKQRMDNGGYYCGIGAYIGYDEEKEMCFIAGLMDGSPALEADVREGDLFYKVDDVEVSGMETSELVPLVKGPEGTTVHLTLYRESTQELIEVDIERAKIDTQSVGSEMLEDNIGYIAISEFNTNTSDQFIEQLAVLKEQGARGIIIDVRSNLGGELTAVCEICRHILPKGMIVYTLDKYGKKNEHLCDGDYPLDLPLVVLTNSYSASASEILTGAVKDHGVGTIVGTKTYGKGVVQTVIPLTDGTAVKLTTSAYYTPSGVCINGVGIEPDIEVEFDADAYYNDGVDNQLNAAIEEIHHKWETAE